MRLVPGGYIRSRVKREPETCHPRIYWLDCWCSPRSPCYVLTPPKQKPSARSRWIQTLSPLRPPLIAASGVLSFQYELHVMGWPLRTPGRNQVGRCDARRWQELRLFAGSGCGSICSHFPLPAAADKLDLPAAARAVPWDGPAALSFSPQGICGSHGSGLQSPARHWFVMTIAWPHSSPLSQAWPHGAVSRGGTW